MTQDHSIYEMEADTLIIKLERDRKNLLRLKKALTMETDSALQYSLKRQVAELEKNILKQEADLERVEKRLVEVKSTSITPMDYDVLAFCHLLIVSEVNEIIEQLKKENIKIELFESDKNDSMNGDHLIKVAVVFVGKREPWREHDVSKKLSELINRRTEIINVILKGVTKEPRFPHFLKSGKMIDLRNKDQNVSDLKSQIEDSVKNADIATR